jgi:hypothetical protein
MQRDAAGIHRPPLHVTNPGFNRGRGPVWIGALQSDEADLQHIAEEIEDLGKSGRWAVRRNCTGCRCTWSNGGSSPRRADPVGAAPSPKDAGKWCSSWKTRRAFDVMRNRIWRRSGASPYTLDDLLEGDL